MTPDRNRNEMFLFRMRLSRINVRNAFSHRFNRDHNSFGGARVAFIGRAVDRHEDLGFGKIRSITSPWDIVWQMT